MPTEDLGPASGPFCVTGATGYISSYVVKLLLGKGYTVRGTTRSTAAEKVAHLTSLPGAAERLTLFEADLLNAGAYDEAITGCAGVFHMASPFFLAGQTEEALIPPAVEGTKNVMASCAKLGVKKVVLTSSTAAVYVQYGAMPPEHVYTEDDWSNEEGMRSHSFWYALSKTLAEQAAWSAVEGSDLSLVTMNPCLVVGPMLQPTLNTSCSAVLAYMNGSKTEVEATPKAIVDVRDVALAHVLGMEKGAYEGRTLLVGASFPWGDAKPWLAEAVPECATGFPSAQQDPASLPPPSEWAMAQPGKHTLYDCSKAESLGITFTSAEDSIKSTALDLKKWGHFATPLAAPAPAPAGCDTRKILYATFTASPGKEAEVASLIAGLQEKVRQEPGNLVFQATTRQGKPGEFFVYEEYVDEAAFQAHISADYGAVFNEKLGTLIEGDGSELFWLNPV